MERDKPKFLGELRRALEVIGFVVLINHPDFRDGVQQQLFRGVRQFFDAPDAVKQTANITLSPYFRGWSRADCEKIADNGEIPPLLAQEVFQYSFDREPLAAHADASVPLWKRVFRGPNTWPTENAVPDFRPSVEYLNDKYHTLTHALGHLICESLGVDQSSFDALFKFDDPDLAASLNHNFGMDCVAPERRAEVAAEFQKLRSDKTGAHIDGPPFIAMLINDRPG